MEDFEFTLNQTTNIQDYQIMKISKLRPQLAKPTIIARVLTIQDLSNSQQSNQAQPNDEIDEQSFYSFELIDDSRNIIQLHLFGSQIQKYSLYLQESKIFQFFNFQIKAHSQQFFPSQHFKIIATQTFTFNEIDSSKKEYAKICSNIPKFYMNFNTIQEIQLENTQSVNNRLYDTAGIVTFSKHQTLESNKNVNHKLFLIINDEEKNQIGVTLWGNNAIQYQKVKKNDILCIRSFKCSKNQGKIELQSMFCSQIFLNPSADLIPECKELYDIREQNIQISPNKQNEQNSENQPYKINNNYFEGQIQIQNTNPLVQEATASLFEVDQKAKQMLKNDRLFVIYFFVKVSFKQINSKIIYYYACPKCQKRVIEKASRCISCKNEFENPLPKIIMNITLSDASHEIQSACLTEQAEVLLGNKAENIIETIKQMEKDLDQSKLLQQTQNMYRDRLNIEYFVKISSKIEDLNKVKKINHVIIKLYSSDDVQYTLENNDNENLN